MSDSLAHNHNTLNFRILIHMTPLSITSTFNTSPLSLIIGTRRVNLLVQNPMVHHPILVIFENHKVPKTLIVADVIILVSKVIDWNPYLIQVMLSSVEITPSGCRELSVPSLLTFPPTIAHR
jgi:hypothetical protein